MLGFFAMFIGHYAPALIAARHPKAPSLGTLFVAAQLVDLGFFAFVLGGVERMRVTPGLTVMNSLDFYHMPYTHSLIGGLVWACLFAAAIFLWRKSPTAALIGGAVVASHWFIDLLVHAPDLTLHGGPPKLGLGLWDYPWIEIPLELALVAGSLWYFAKETRDAQRGNRPLWILGAVLVLLQIYSWAAPEPEAVTAELPITALAAYAVMAAVAGWAVRGRRALLT